MRMADHNETGTTGDSGYRSIAEVHRYSMKKSRRGIAVIISNENFQDHTKCSQRSGNEKDKANLKALFKSLKFSVDVYDDQTTEQMMNIIKKVASHDHSDHDCFILAIMSHGEQDVVFGTDGKIELNNLLGPLKANKCKTLIGKPKLFFIQACRGNEIDEGVEYNLDYETDADEADEKITKIPKEADYLYCFSTAYGYVSYRNQFGSWYIQALRDIFEQHSRNCDILTMLTFVNNRIKEMASNTRIAALCKKKQIPEFTSMLTKLLYFD